MPVVRCGKALRNRRGLIVCSKLMNRLPVFLPGPGLSEQGASEGSRAPALLLLCGILEKCPRDFKIKKGGQSLWQLFVVRGGPAHKKGSGGQVELVNPF